MNFEELKQSWDKLSERLDREEVLRKQELRMVTENKVKSYWNKIRMNQYLGWLVLVGCIGMLYVQGIQNDPFGWIVIGTVILLDVIFFSPMWKILKLLAKFDMSIVEQEQMILHYRKLFIRNSIVVACFIASIFVALIVEMLNKQGEVSNSWWLWLAATILISTIIGFTRTSQEKEQIDEIHERLTKLKEWESAE